MASPTSFRLLQALGLAAPLIGIAAWLVFGAMNPAPVQKTSPPASTPHPTQSKADGPTAIPASPAPGPGITASSSPLQPPPTPEAVPIPTKPAEKAESKTENPWTSFADPTTDFAANALEDRVDGAAEFLRSLGCYRLVYWRSETPPAEFELLVFKTGEGAHAALERDAGPERTPGLGDEAQISPQAIYFRRGPFFARLFLDPEAKDPEQSLKQRAASLDQILAKGVKL